jgi:ribokinase
VICIGAALVDMVAQVERHPEEDDEVFVSDLKLLSGGAAANTAYACAKLGLKTAFLGKLGRNDTFGAKILSDFNEVKVDKSLIKYSDSYGTGSAYVALNRVGDRRIYAHSGAANYLSDEDILEDDLINTKLIYLSSLKNLDPFIKAAEIGRKNNIDVILNPGMLIIDQGFDNIKKLLEKIPIIIMSKREFMTLFAIQEISEELIKERSSTLFNLGIKILIVTMGKQGAFLMTTEESKLFPAKSVSKVVDTTGAGDAFSAGFIFGFHDRLDYEFKSLDFPLIVGNDVAGQCIQELGARNGIPEYKDRGSISDLF